MNDHALLAAARNNAEWCDAVCRSHGLTTEWRAGVWSTPHGSPRFYPDAVTLSPRASAEDVLGRVDVAPGCSVKDSFATLDLAPSGFRVLFDATWVRLGPGPSGSSVAAASDAAEAWSDVRSPAGLATWAAAHGAGDVLRPALLDDTAITVLARGDADEPSAGAVVSASGPFLGLSNVFTTGDDPARTWGELAVLLAHRWAGRTVVGYESGDDLTLALGAGFEELGPLRVWIRD